jgi:thermostable 8-oxoguanine DNA glycosylase
MRCRSAVATCRAVEDTLANQVVFPLIAASEQSMTAVIAGCVHSLSLPAPDTALSNGAAWGRFDDLFTPAFWRGQVWQHQLAGHYQDNRLGRTLREETAACLLGGFGMPAELGLAAYNRLRSDGLLEPGVTEATLCEALSRPLKVGGVLKRYRFHRQKARHLAGALEGLKALTPPDNDQTLRDALTRLPGVGLKTASWIVRNYRASDAVAIIDIHVLRAGRLAGVFSPDLEPARDYRRLEEAFLVFAQEIEAPASALDALIWDYMRRMPPSVVGMKSDADDSRAQGAKPTRRGQGLKHRTSKEAERAKAEA